MYVRFVVSTLDKDSGRRQGALGASWDLLDTQTLTDFERDQIHEILLWLGKHLKVPDRFARSRRSQPHHEAICWFKDSAVDCVRRMRDLCRILGEHGIATEMLPSSHPGYVVYDDENQVAAVPFAETTT